MQTLAAAADESQWCPGLASPQDGNANRGVARPAGAILVGFVAVPVSDRRGSGTYHNS